MVLAEIVPLALRACGDVAVPVLTGLMCRLPAALRRSLTWDLGGAVADNHTFRVAAACPICFCDPHSPWQRGSNENTNGLLRQYFPKGIPLDGHTQHHLDPVADELNGRPRKTSAPCDGKRGSDRLSWSSRAPRAVDGLMDDVLGLQSADIGVGSADDDRDPLT